MGCFMCVSGPEDQESGGKLTQTHKDSNFEDRNEGVS